MAILLCTSLRPSPRTRTFCNDLVGASSVFTYHLRGKTSFLLLSAYAHSSGADRLWVVNSRFGQPKLIECYDCKEIRAKKLASFLIERVTLRRELQSEARSKRRNLKIIYPEDYLQKKLYATLVEAVGRMPADGPFAELHIEPYEDGPAELTFIDAETQTPCGPKILLKDYR
jgi:rRNA maturation protein Rpf1